MIDLALFDEEKFDSFHEIDLNKCSIICLSDRVETMYRLWILCLLICFTEEFLFKSRSSSFKIGSFNLRRYSSNKASTNNSINTQIAKILKRYDLIFLQEIIDASDENQVVNLLLQHLHKQSRSNQYEAIISPPLGSTSYKERLVYLYRKKASQFQILGSYVYNGSMKDSFERKPFILHLKVFPSKQTMIFIGVHLRPDHVFEEFRSLRTIVDQLKEKGSIVLLGDFNADCSYLNNAKKKQIRTTVFNDFIWLIDDRTETNLLESCSYDRILISSGTISWKKNSNGTYPFDKKFKLSKKAALQISDHYPVEVDLYG